MHDLDKFLNQHRPNDKYCTHTRIGSSQYNIHGGKYNIGEADLPLFYKLYHKKVFIDKLYEHLVERPNRTAFPILIDLDFRFSTSIEERQHNEEYIIDVIHVYLEKLHEILDIRDATEFPIYVFEKPHMNQLADIVKDGIHIIFGITMDATLQLMLRSRVLTDIQKIFESLPLENDIDNIVDARVSSGSSGWQMYGSRKPGNEAYELVHYYNAEWEGGEWSELDEVDISNYNNFDLLLQVSALKKDNISYEMKESVQEEYASKKKPAVSTTTSKPKMHYGYMDYTKIRNKNDLMPLVKDFLEGLNPGEYNIREIHEFTMILPRKYYEEYDKWLLVGFALHNTDKRLFLTWMAFSSQSDKFNINDISKFMDTWHGMRDEGVTERSIIYWAKESNLEEYKKIHNETINHYIDDCIAHTTDHNMALIVYKMFEGQYICASIKNKLWYAFTNNKWNEIDSGTTLRNKITKIVAAAVQAKMQDWIDKLPTLESETIREAVQKKIIKALQITKKMGMVDGKNKIMREAQELFYDEEFFERLDANPYLLHFKNGVIDFQAETINELFRTGRPEDYLSLSTKQRYVKFDKKNKEHAKYKKEIDEFFEQLFPDKDLRRYMLEHLASTLIGTNENETFNIYNGVGRNGKSKLVDLMGKVLGQLKGVVPLSLVTRKREGSGKASPELARLRGVRYAVMQEPSKNDKINEGQMKELTGGDAIQARALFRDPIEFKPQFKLAVCTNNLFDIPSNDDGTWRRIRVCEFLSKFCNNPSPDSKDKEFKGITPSKLLAKFDRWVPVFTSMLADMAFKTQGKVIDCDMVMLASKKYRCSQDYLGKFFEETIAENVGSRMSWTNVWETFKTWYGELSIGRTPRQSEVKNFMEKRCGIYPKGGWRDFQIIQQE